MHSQRRLLLAVIYWVTILYEGDTFFNGAWKTWEGMLDFDNGEIFMLPVGMERSAEAGEPTHLLVSNGYALSTSL